MQLRTLTPLAAWLLATALIAWGGAACSQTKPQPNNEPGALGAQQGSTQPTQPPSSLSQEQITKAVADGINAAAREYESRHPAPPPDNSGWWFNFFLVVFTGGLVVVGAAQCFLIFWNLRATETAANAAKASAEAVVSQLRAYIHVSLMGAPTIDAQRVLRVSVGVKNTGQTPAYDTTIVSNIGIVSWPPPRPLETIFIDTNAPALVRITIPGGETSLNVPEMPSFTAGEEAGLRAGAYRIVVWGRVNYTDAFKNQRTTRYAFSLRWEDDQFGEPFYEAVGNSSD